MSSPRITGSVKDPEFRKRRARHAAKARTTVDAHIRALVDAAPTLTDEQRARLAVLLRGAESTPDGEAA